MPAMTREELKVLRGEVRTLEREAERAAEKAAAKRKEAEELLLAAFTKREELDAAIEEFLEA